MMTLTRNGDSTVISSCERYRYMLERSWSAGSRVTWVMLNPSTADGTHDDATIRKCVGFSKRWGHGGMRVVNIFAFRSTDPKAMFDAEDPVGFENDWYIDRVVAMGGQVVLAWGAHGPVKRVDRVCSVISNAGGKSPQCLGLTKNGNPRHPLMLPYSTPLREFRL